jgi:cytochrome c biogenesis protein CcdA
MESAGTQTFFTVVTSYEVYIAAVAIVAITTATKRFWKCLENRKGQLVESPWFLLIFDFQNVGLGALIGLTAFLPGHSVFERVLVGVVTGFLSDKLYDVIKRFLPDTMMANKGAKGILQRNGSEDPK